MDSVPDHRRPIGADRRDVNRFFGPVRPRPKKPIYVTPVGPDWAAVVWNRVHLYGWVGGLLRSAADFVGYRDYEPWWTASQHWVAEYEAENNCPVCSGQSSA